VRDFARNVVKPTARQYDLDSPLPLGQRQADGGARPLRHSLAGGAGGSGWTLSYITVIHELAKVDASHAITVSATPRSALAIMDFGTDEQKQRFVPFLATGKVLGGFGLTEPGPALMPAVRRPRRSIARSLRPERLEDLHHSRRRRRDFCVTARTDPAAKRTHGITAFIVTKDTCDLEETKRIGIGHAADLPKNRGSCRARKRQARLAGVRHA